MLMWYIDSVLTTLQIYFIVIFLLLLLFYSTKVRNCVLGCLCAFETLISGIDMHYNMNHYFPYLRICNGKKEKKKKKVSIL